MTNRPLQPDEERTLTLRATEGGVEISSDLGIPLGYVRTTCSLHPNFVEMTIDHLPGEDDRHG